VSADARDFRVIAIISAYNEGDIIAPVIGHLVENGVDVYLIDDNSTDDTIDQASSWLGRGLIEIESAPPRVVTASGLPGFEWTAILQRKEELSASLEADWFMHHDADEIRDSPWPGMTLKAAIAWVDSLSYNCIDFHVLNFPPVDDGFRRGDDPRKYFTRYEEAAEYDRRRLNCWKAGMGPVSLVELGGHEVVFEGRREFPIRFLFRHYPIRGQKHGVRKVFAERKNRFLERERELGWHHQYERFKDSSHSFLVDPAQLRPFDLDQARLELMVRNEVTEAAQERAARAEERILALDSEAEVARADLETPAARLEEEMVR
jgi:glycosyltransferase involved in cell wall biosynthesis